MATDASLLDHSMVAPATGWPFPSSTDADNCTVSPRAMSVADDGSIAILPADCITVTGTLADALPE